MIPIEKTLKERGLRQAQAVQTRMKFPVLLRCSAHDTSEALDLRRRATTPLVDLGNVDVPTPPVWTPDGKAILYARYGPVEGEIVRHVLDGSVPDLVLRLPGTVFCPGRSRRTAGAS